MPRKKSRMQTYGRFNENIPVRLTREFSHRIPVLLVRRVDEMYVQVRIILLQCMHLISTERLIVDL